MNILSDLENNFKRNGLFVKCPAYRRVLEEIDYDYGDHGIYYPLAAGGDARESWTEIIIGDYKFRYSHVHSEGEIGVSSFVIMSVEEEKDVEESDREESDDKDTNKEIIFSYSMMDAMKAMIKANRDAKAKEEGNVVVHESIDHLHQRELLDKFLGEYGLTLEEGFEMFGILNAFPFGRSVNLYFDKSNGDRIANIQHLDEMITIYNTGEDGSDKSGSEDLSNMTQEELLARIDFSKLNPIEKMLLEMMGITNVENSVSDEC